jgi:iron(III) transport system ATP-binding protein
MIPIKLNHIVKRFGQTTAVNDVSLDIPAGALFFLLGPSGCGKTTLLRMIAGFTLPTSGQILFGDKDMSQVPPYKRDTGMVFQSYALWPHMTVGENVGFGLDVRKVEKTERARRIGEALDLVQMGHLRDRKPNQLSGGQQQRVALARALSIRPKCLLLDEPLSNLDAKLRAEMRVEIRRIVKAVGITAIYVTHDQKEALSMADGIAVMRAGALQQAGSPTDLYRHPANRFVADFIGESNFLPGTVASVDGGTVSVTTELGMIASSSAKGARVGEKVLLAFRPEAVRLADTSSREINAIGGRRVSTTYLGEIAEHMVTLANGSTVKAFELNPSQAAATSDLCVVHVPPEDVMLVPAEQVAA